MVKFMKVIYNGNYCGSDREIDILDGFIFSDIFLFVLQCLKGNNIVDKILVLDKKKTKGEMR